MKNLTARISGKYVPAFLVALALATLEAQAQLIVYDAGTGAITWNTSTVISPLVQAILAGVAGVTTIFVIVMGIRFIFKMVKRAA